jgi:hypothetical protein
MYLQKVNEKTKIFVGVLKVTDESSRIRSLIQIRIRTRTKMSQIRSTADDQFLVYYIISLIIFK